MPQPPMRETKSGRPLDNTERRDLQNYDMIKPLRAWDTNEVADELNAMTDLEGSVLSWDQFLKDPQAIRSELQDRIDERLEGQELLDAIRKLTYDDLEMGYVRHLGRYWKISHFTPEWWEPTGYLVPTTTGPFWVVGPPELVVEAVGHASMPLATVDGKLFAVRPQGVALPDDTPFRWFRLIGASRRGRAGLLWVPPQGYGD